jgi:orotidine-5'-phosphate decarboxylase
MPPGLNVADFNKAIIAATCDTVCAYKPNLAFYEALGDDGAAALKATLRAIPADIPVIADAKRGDIGNTAKAYAVALFDRLGFDAATVSPYLGRDSVEPFLAYGEKCVFILCRTSNPGSTDFQSLRVQTPAGSRPLFEVVADTAAGWNQRENVGLVVGATYPDELKTVRHAHPETPILVPGVGAQGGDLALTIRNGADSRRERTIVNSSRQVLYASRGKDFAQAARAAAGKLRDEINAVLAEMRAGGV